MHGLRRARLFPQPVRISRNRVAWRESDIDLWINSREVAEGSVTCSAEVAPEFSNAIEREHLARERAVHLAEYFSRQIRIHDLRHTFASLLIQNGEPLTYVKEQMGHSSIQVTVDVYGHLVPSGNRAAVDKLDAVPTRIPDASVDENANAANGGK